MAKPLIRKGQRTQQLKLHTRPETGAAVEPEAGVAERVRAEAARDVLPGGAAPAVARDLVPPMSEGRLPDENADPLKRRIWRTPPRSWPFRAARWLWGHRPWRRPSDDERRHRDEMAKRRGIETLLRSEAELFHDRIVNTLSRLGLCYKYKKSEKSMIVKRTEVNFDLCLMQPDAIYFRVRTSKLPDDVEILKLVDPRTLTDLSIACGCNVSAEYNAKIGCWYIVERGTGVRAIPEHVRIEDLWEAFPASANALALPIGTTVNGKQIYCSLNQMYHLLLAGTTGGGKSNFIHAALCTLIRRNAPERLRLVLMDFKGGLELTRYDDIPHILDTDTKEPGRVIYRPEVGTKALKIIWAEAEERFTRMRNEKCSDLGRYNAKHRARPLASIVVLIDEISMLIKSAQGREVEQLLVQIAQQGRAVGIHLVLCTQMPKVEIITGLIKANLPGKLALNCSTNQGSMAIIDTGRACHLHPVGRGIFQWEDELEVQTPYINDAVIQQVIEAAKAGEYSAPIQRAKHDVTPEDIWKWSLEREDGKLTFQRVYQAFRSRGLGQVECNSILQSHEGKEVIYGGVTYLVRAGDGSAPRQLVVKDS